MMRAGADKTKKKLQKIEQEKIRRINLALEADPVDVEQLRQMATWDGLINDGLRCKVWPRLLNVDKEKPPSDFYKAQWHHKDVDQVARDVDRSLWKQTVGKAGLRKMKREQLTRIINAILDRNPELHYYQGFHDIASIFLLVAGNEEEAFAMMERLSKNHIRYALNSSLDSTKKVLFLLFPLIAYADPELHQFFVKSSVEPFFALSWVLTWFSHGFDDLDIVARLFDLFIASHPLMPLYLGAEIIIHFRDEILSNVECEYSAVHGFMTTITQDLPFDKLIRDSLRLFDQLPPNKLQKRALYLGSGSPVNRWPYSWMSMIQRPDRVKEKLKAFSTELNIPAASKEGEASTVEKVCFWVLFTALAGLFVSVTVSRL